MTTFKQLEQKLANVNIEGANLGAVSNAKFTKLTDFLKSNGCVVNEITFLDEDLKILSKLEKYYLKILNTDVKITPLQINEDGKAIINNGQLCHRANGRTISSLSTYSVLGVVASEWFGHVETEGEAWFCTFLTRMMKEDPQRSLIYNKQCRINRNTMTTPDAKGTIVFYFDETNPLMQELVNLDFYEYAHLKATNPQCLKTKYKPDMLKLLDELLYPISSGKTMHNNPDERYYNWLAIPAGIPPQLINGICIHSKNAELVSHLDEIAILFPNATIFDENNNVLHEVLVFNNNVIV